jgi:hypothetical protein
VLAPSTPNKYELAKRFQLSGNPLPADQISQSPDLLGLHQYVDARDQVNNWCVGQIIETNSETQTVTVHFDGWSDKYNVELPKKTSKIAPFRSYSRGYTGQQKVALRTGWSLNQTTFVMLETKIKEVIQSKFTCFESANACTQFIRGELYIFVDSILSLYTNITSNDLPAIVEFMQLVFELILAWMEIFPLYYQSFKECEQHPLLFCVDLPAAISQCGFELSEILGKIWGLCRRTNATFT